MKINLYDKSTLLSKSYQRKCTSTRPIPKCINNKTSVISGSTTPILNVERDNICADKTADNNNRCEKKTTFQIYFYLFRLCKLCWHLPKRIWKCIYITISILLITMSLYYFFVVDSHKNVRSYHSKRGIVDGELIPPNPELPLPPSYAKMHLFRRAAVSSDSEICSEIGREVLRNSKKAHIIDATLSTMFCNGLVTMQSMGVGGGFIMNLYIKSEKKSYTINARERAPQHFKITNDKLNYQLQTNNDTSQQQQRQQQTDNVGELIAIPGEVAGYWELYKKYSRLTWKEILQPTLNLCRHGFVLTKHMADFLRPEFKYDKHFRKMFVNPKTNEFYMAGEHIYPHKKLCIFYELLSEHGGDSFYNGTVSESILLDLISLKSKITANDLKSYRVKWTESTVLEINNNNFLHITPPPSSGYLVGFILNILKGYKWIHWDENNDNNMIIKQYHRIIETFKFAYAKRMKFGDPDFVNLKELIKNLTSTEYAEEIRKYINDTQTYTNYEHYGVTKEDLKLLSPYGTSHVSIIAPNGDAVSVTSSINYYFGCGQTGMKTSIIYNSGLADFSLPNRQKDYFSLPSVEPNKPESYKQAVSSMAPIILTTKTGMVTAVIGASGGSKIPTAISMALIRILWMGKDIKESIDAPRLHHQLYPMTLEYEYGNLNQIMLGLEKLGHRIERYTQRGSIISAITRNQNGIFAIADYRKRGEVLGF